MVQVWRGGEGRGHTVAWMGSGEQKGFSPSRAASLSNPPTSELSARSRGCRIARMLRIAISKGRLAGAKGIWEQGRQLRAFSSSADHVDLEGNLSLQAARTWDEGVKSNFATTPLKEIFKDKKVVIFGLPGAYTGVCTTKHVPSYINQAETLKQKGVDRIICVAVNDPYVMNAWAEKLNAKDKLEFFGDFDGSFHKSLSLDCDLSSGLLGPRSQRWSAFVVNGQIKALNVEKVPSDFEVSGADTILKCIR